MQLFIKNIFISKGDTEKLNISTKFGMGSISFLITKNNLFLPTVNEIYGFYWF